MTDRLNAVFALKPYTIVTTIIGFSGLDSNKINGGTARVAAVGRPNETRVVNMATNIGSGADTRCADSVHPHAVGSYAYAKMIAPDVQRCEAEMIAAMIVQ